MTHGVVLPAKAGRGKSALKATGSKTKSVAAQELAPDASAMGRRVERWTPAKRELFITRLAETGNVTLSLSDTGMSNAGLYRLRNRSAAFRASWDEALDQGYVRVEAMLLDRALNGRRRVFRKGVIVDEFIECTDSLGLRLLAHHRKRVSEYRVAASIDRDNPERLRERFMVKLQRMARAAGWQG